jgi:hypothetical protein
MTLIPDSQLLDLKEKKPLTPEQLETGVSEIRRMINLSVGYRFADDIVPFAHKELALRALDHFSSLVDEIVELRKEIERLISRGLLPNG